MEDRWRVVQLGAKVHPVLHVIAHMIAAEGQHRKGITAQLAHGAGRRSGHLATHGGSGVHAVVPVERLINQWHIGHTASAEDERADRHALGILPCRINGRALRGWRGKAAIRMAAGSLALGRPVIAVPVGQVRRDFVGHLLPPNVVVISLRDVGEDGIRPAGFQRILVCFCARARCHAKKASLRIDRIKFAIITRLDPRDVITNGRDFPALHFRRRNEHGEVRLATGTRERRRHVGRLTLGTRHAENQHVFRQPTLLTRHR